MLTANEIDSVFQTWSRDYQNRQTTMRERVRNALAGGQTIVETWDAIAGPQRTEWALGCPTFIVPYNRNPDYLAEHLCSRHFGFGFDLTINGTTYNLGKAA